MEKKSNGSSGIEWEQVKDQLSIALALNRSDVKQTKTNETTYSYPTIPNFDDQIISKEAVLYDVFVFGDTFHHFEMSPTNAVLQFEGIMIELTHENLFFNQQKWETPMIRYNGERFFAVPHQSLNVFTTNLPYDKLIISENKGSDIAFPTTAFAIIGPKMKDSPMKEEDFFLSLSVDQECVYLNEQRIFNGTYTLKVGDRLIIGGIAMEYRLKQLKLTEIYQQVTLNPWKLLPQAFEPEVPMNFPDFRRSPRILLQQPTEKIAIQLPESLMDTGKSDIIRTILPPLGMLVASGATSLLSGGNPLMMVGMGSASLLTAALSVSSYFTNKKDFAHKKVEREENYQSYLLEKSAELDRLAQKQQQTFDYHFPDLEKLAQLVTNYSPRIYEKTINNADYLEFSLGTGELTSSYEVAFDGEQAKDPLVLFAKEHIVEPYSVVKQAPISTNLQKQTLGLVGTYPVLRIAVSSILFQLASFHSYRDVEFIVLLPEEHYEKDWKHWWWLPHFQIHSLNLRGLIHNAQGRDMILNSFYQLMYKRKQDLGEAVGNHKKSKFSPHFVLTILEDSWLVGHGLNEFLAEDMTDYGVTVIWGKEAAAMLPETVTTLVKYNSNESGQLVNEKNVYIAKDFKPYRLPIKFPLDQAIRRLANLHHVEVKKNAIPGSVGFLEMYQVKEVGELRASARWQSANTAKSLAVPLGYRGKGELVTLNLQERAHGPHGLVAGTTGSGKSEIVQSYVLSLAINFAPEDVGFLPIDFKGGGMANLFANLPHLLGSITNLDGAGSSRALASIHAELQKRQRYFEKYGVNHINGYTKLYKAGKEVHDPEEKKKYPHEPLPHLFLISDEFAEVKANEPEFMAELVSTARIGRSLGVHLILATQKPSGVVDDQIWSNARFKLALKVQDTSDSNEILKTPDAANITLPGRAYLQVGNNEIYELFQSAWSGATYDPESVHEEKVDERIWKINDLGQYELLTTDLSGDEEVGVAQEEQMTELEAIVEYLAIVAKQTQAILPEKPWLPPLETEICTPPISREQEWQGTRELTVPFAFMDIPSQQAQETFFFDFNAFSHTAIYGSAGFGKSVALQTLVMNLARKNTPEQLHFYLLDFGTNGLLPLKDLPHVADLIHLEEAEKLVKCVKKIRQELTRRKDEFSVYGVSSLSQYEAKSSKSLPVEVIVLDSYDPLRESRLEEAIESVLNQLLREGASLGMYLVATALRSDSFKISMTSNLPTRMALYLIEENAVKDIVGRDALIPQGITGRIQLKLDEPIVMQVYLPTEGSNDIERLNNLEAEIKEMDQVWSGDRPAKIPMAPKRLTAKEFYSYREVEKHLSEGNLPFGMSLETTEIVAFSPVEDGYCVIADDTPSQTELLYWTIIEGFKKLQRQYYRLVFDYGNQFESTIAFDQLVSDDEYNRVALELLGEIDNRLENKAIPREKILVYIPEVVPFSEKIRLFEDQVKKMLKNGPKVGIYFIFQSSKSKLDIAFDDISKILRNNPPTGLVGSRLTDQEYIKVKRNFSEPELEYGQHNFYAQRKPERIKLISEW